VSDERKEKVIHTRIPAALEEQIKRLAEGLRVPVSNLVRNMLEDAITMTRRMREQLPAAIGGTPPAPPAPDLSAVYGWQALTLNVATPCARCGKELGPGDDAYLGLSDARDPRVFICPACLPRREQPRSSRKAASKKE
jgi:hypothetical protein